MRHLVELPFHCLIDFRVVVTQAIDSRAARRIDVPLARGVEDVNACPASRSRQPRGASRFVEIRQE